jgi:hypothetical protein
MADRPTISEAVLGRLLEDVAEHLEAPPRDDVVAAVRTRLEAEPPPEVARLAQRGLRSRRVRFALAGFAVVIAVSTLLTFSPTTRRAVANWFGLLGVRIERQEGPLPGALGERFSLGEQVELAEARQRLPFDVLLPRTRRFGQPDEVYVANTPSGGRVSLVFSPRSGLPPAAESGVGLLVTEFRARIPDQVLRKVIGPDVHLEEVTVDGERGYWFEGAPHVLAFADERGRFFEDRSRLAGNTLIWERGLLTLRLESGLSKDRAIRIAESLEKSGQDP